MAENEKRKLQNLILLIAKEIVRICNKYDITYYLDSGTQLGAVRHNGFIPWDDDFDIAMKRLDYERFLNICEKELDKTKFFLQTEWTEKNYCFTFAKIQLLGTEIIEDFSKEVDIHHGIFVDIFPYDNLPDNSKQQKWFLYKNYILKNLLWVKCGYGTSIHKRKIGYCVFKLLSRLFSIEDLKIKRYKLIVQNNKNNTKLCFTSDYPKIKLQNAWFNEFSWYKFETEKFRGFKRYDSYLKTLYGEYMQLPPIEKRIQHSNYKINFGIYENDFKEKEVIYDKK